MRHVGRRWTRRRLGDRGGDAGLDPHGVEPGRPRPLDVGLELIADHHGVRRAGAAHRLLEDRRVGLAEPDETQVGPRRIAQRQRTLEHVGDRAGGEAEPAAATGIDQIGVRHHQVHVTAGVDSRPGETRAPRRPSR